MTSGDQKVPSIQTHFKTLASVAPTLNAASDELTQAVTTLDEALKKLNVGLTTWVTFRSRAVYGPAQDDEEYDVDQIGYGKVEGKWGIALRHVWGNYALEEFGIEGPWLFNDAPRELRLLGVDKILELIEALGKEALDTTKKIQEKTKQVRELAGAIEQITHADKKGTKPPPSATRPIKGVSFATSGLTAAQVKGMLTGVQERQKFLGELLEHASRWELGSSDLWIYFPAAKRPFAEMLEGRESISKVSDVAKDVLGYPVQVVVKLEPPVTNTSTAGNDKGGK